MPTRIKVDLRDFGLPTRATPVTVSLSKRGAYVTQNYIELSNKRTEITEDGVCVFDNIPTTTELENDGISPATIRFSIPSARLMQDIYIPDGESEINLSDLVILNFPPGFQVPFMYRTATVWQYGTGAPEDTDFRDGDWYLDTETTNAYKKVFGHWVFILRIGLFDIAITSVIGLATTLSTLDSLIEQEETIRSQQYTNTINALAGKVSNEELLNEQSARHEHELRVDNPHSVNYEQAGAAPLNHNHDARYNTKDQVVALISELKQQLTGMAPELLNSFEEVAARVEAGDDAFSAFISAITAQLAGIVASVVDESEARADADNGLSLLIAQKTTDIFNLNTALGQEVSARGNADSLLSAALNLHATNTNNPHNVTATQVGLGQVTNDAQVKRSELDQPLGPPTLDNGGYLKLSQIPVSLLGAVRYQSLWNASTNTPPIGAASNANKGFYYIVSVAGATNLSGITDWGVGDWAVSDGVTWDKIDNSEMANTDVNTTAQDPTNANAVATLRVVLANLSAAIATKATISSVAPPPDVLTDAATIVWNINNRPKANATVTLGGNRALSMTNLSSGAEGILLVTQDATGGRTLTLPTGSLQVGGGGTIASISPSPSAVSILAWWYNGTNIIWNVGQNVS